MEATRWPNSPDPTRDTTTAVDAVGKATEALEYVERARGHLYAFHQLIGRADYPFRAERPWPRRRGSTQRSAGHSPEMPVHYDLHAWIWKANPDGVFTSWNPNVVCPTQGGEVHDH